MISGNVVNQNGGQAFVLNGPDGQGRTSMDITITNNTAIDTGSTGNFIRVNGYVAGITMTNNLWVAPKLQLGVYSSAPVYVANSDLSSFSKIGANIWPSPVSVGTYADGGINFVGSSYTSANFLTATEWNSFSVVSQDDFTNVELASTYQISYQGITAGSNLKMAA